MSESIFQGMLSAMVNSTKVLIKEAKIEGEDEDFRKM